MKIIHLADVHLDSKLTTHLSGDKVKKRRWEILQTFNNVVEFADKEGVSAIIIAGDFFDSKTVSEKTKKSVFERIEEYSNIDFLYLCGNHDENLSVLTGRDLPSNLKTFSDKITTYNYESVDISGLELSPSNYQSFYSDINLSSVKPNIFVLHGQAYKIAIGNNTTAIDLRLLSHKGINYLALGDYHKYSEGKLDNNGVYVYSGCLEGRGFDELGEKGFVLLNVEGSKISHKFVPFAKRQLEKLQVNVSGVTSYLELEKLVEQKLLQLNKNWLAKVELVGDVLPDSKLDFLSLKTKFENYLYFVAFEDKTKLKIDVSYYQNDASLKGEFVRLVLKSDHDEETKNAIILAGFNALRGQEVL